MWMGNYELVIPLPRRRFYLANDLYFFKKKKNVGERYNCEL